MGPQQSLTAFALRDYFFGRCDAWSRVARVKVGDSSLRSAILVKAVFGLTHRGMRWDGALVDEKGRPRQLEGRNGLAEIMGVSKPTALKVIAILRAEGSMTENEMRDDQGYVRASDRRLQVPSLSKRSSTNVDSGDSESLSQQNRGPESTKQGSLVNTSDRLVYSATGRKREEQEEGFMSGDIATSGDISHQGNEDQEEDHGSSRRTPAPKEAPTGSVDGAVGPGDGKRVRVLAAWETTTEWPEGPDGEPCYAHLDADQWESIRRQLPHDRNFRLRAGEVEMTAIGSRLTLWFRYGYHLKVAKDDGPLLRSLVRAELGPDIVVELLPMSEREDLVVVA